MSTVTKKLGLLNNYPSLITLMGRNMGVEPMHNRATIYRVNHFTNSAITVNRISKNWLKINTLSQKCGIIM